MSGDAARPLELDLDRRRHLRVRWADGVEHVIPLVEIRRACPCATCKADREERERNPLRVIAPVADELAMVTAGGATLAGHYAIRIAWNDGHDTGIYDFALLRRLGEGLAKDG